MSFIEKFFQHTAEYDYEPVFAGCCVRACPGAAAVRRQWPPRLLSHLHTAHCAGPVTGDSTVSVSGMMSSVTIVIVTTVDSDLCKMR